MKLWLKTNQPKQRMCEQLRPTEPKTCLFKKYLQSQSQSYNKNGNFHLV
jgi:hypothetical protein